MLVFDLTYFLQCFPLCTCEGGYIGSGCGILINGGGGG